MPGPTPSHFTDSTTMALPPLSHLGSAVTVTVPKGVFGPESVNPCSIAVSATSGVM